MESLTCEHREWSVLTLALGRIPISSITIESKPTVRFTYTIYHLILSGSDASSRQIKSNVCVRASRHRTLFFAAIVEESREGFLVVFEEKTIVSRNVALSYD